MTDETINHIISKCSKLAQKEYKTWHHWVIKMIHWEMCKKFKFEHTKEMVYAQPSTSPRKWHTQTPMGLWHTNRSPNLGQKTRSYSNQQKEKVIFKIVDFTVPADHKIKLKECEKKDKYFDLATELKKLWNMKVTIVPIVIGAFGTITKGLLKGMADLEVGGWVETIQTTAFLRTARILSPGDLRRLAVTQTPVKNHQLKLMWKTLKE